MAARSRRFGTLLAGLSFSSSGIPSDERDELFRVIKSNGGTSSKRLDGSVKFLLINEPVGAKFEYASKMKFEGRNIECVRPEWLLDSIAAAKLLDVGQYCVLPRDVADEHEEKKESGAKRRESQRGDDSPKRMKTQHNEAGLFAGFVFYFDGVSGEEREDALTAIEQHSGSCSSELNGRVSHIVASVGSYGESRTNVVSLYWIYASILQQKLVDVGLSPLYRPLKGDNGIPSMRALTIALTGFVGTERDEVKEMIRFSGASYTGSLSRSNTHLIAKERSGKKFETALLWEMFVVSVKWIEECLRQWSRISEAEFPLELQGDDMEGDVGILAPSSDAREVGEASAVFESRDEDNHADSEKLRRVENPTDHQASFDVDKAESVDESKPLAIPREREKKVTEAQPKNEYKDFSGDAEAKRRVRAVTVEGGDSARSSYVFTISSSITKDRQLWTRHIRRLGGTVVPSGSSWNPSTTHVIQSVPRRTEKLLFGVVSGVWIVSPDYILDSHAKGRFLEEEKYEWANVQAPAVNPSLWPGCTRRARLAKKNATFAPFEGWKGEVGTFPVRKTDVLVALYGNTEPKVGTLSELIRMGGGTVLAVAPPFPSSQLTHLFASTTTVLDETISEALATGVKVLAPSFILDTLTMESPPKVGDTYQLY